MIIQVVHDLLEHSAHVFSGKEAIFFKNKSMSFYEIREKSARLGGFLNSIGSQRGDRVAIYLEKRFEKVISIFGISISGGVFVPVRRLLHVNQVGHIISDCQAKVLITTGDRIPLLKTIAHKLSSLEFIIVISNKKENINYKLGRAKVLDWEDAIFFAANKRRHDAVENDLAAILYTSGSTGNPKGVVLSHLNIVAGAKKVSEYLKMTQDDRLLSILTFAFDYGLNQLTGAFLHGAQVVLLDYLFPSDIIKAVNKYSITGLAAVATTWIQLLQSQWTHEDVPTLRYITNSGGAIPEYYVRELRKRIPITDIYLMYGLTEAFRSTYLDPKLVDEKPTSMGKAIPGEEILVLDADDKPIKPGQIGQLVHRGVLVAQGYWNAPDITAIRYRVNPLQAKEIPIKEMVVYSGDYVRMDEDGFLYFIGRNDEMIKSAGNRISPTEVEEILYSTGKIQDTIVLGIPHKIYGHAIKALIVPRENTSITAAEIIEYCKKMSPPYMIPSDIEFRKELPRNANGKLDRARVKKEIYQNLSEENKSE